jgi:hypothetical protein
VRPRGTDNLKARPEFFKGRKHPYSLNKGDNFPARKMVEDPIVLDPKRAVVSGAATMMGCHPVCDKIQICRFSLMPEMQCCLA